jgi:diguanylate cyclase (GGDEF)-like protein
MHLVFTTATLDRGGYSLTARLCSIIGFLGVLPVLGAAFALVIVAGATRDNSSLDRTARGAVHLERINRLIYAVVMESRGIYISPDWKAAEPFADNLTQDLVELQDVAKTWRTEALVPQQSNVDELTKLIDEFVRLRTELVRLAREDSTLSARDFGNNDANRKVRTALNESLSIISHGSEREIAWARIRVGDNNRYLVYALVTLSCVACIGLCGGLMLIRSGLRERTRLSLETKQLSELSEGLQSCNSLQELYEIIGHSLSRLMPACGGSLYVFANSRDVLENAKSWNGGRVQPTMHPDDCWGLRLGRLYTYCKDATDFPCVHLMSEQPKEYCCIPILAHGETIGLLHLEFHCKDGEPQDLAEQRHLGLVCAEQMSLAIANIKLRDQLRDESIRDSVTGLFNRRYMLETCRREFSRAARAAQPVSLLTIDVDHFKKYNDNHGHDAGDTVLRALGACMETMFRNEDVPCRFGGEEFVVLLPGAPIDVAVRRAEQLRSKIEGLVVRYLEETLPRITISVGVAGFPGAGDNPEAVLKAADVALYQAKANGRNRVELSTPAGRQILPGERRTTHAAPETLN